MASTAVPVVPAVPPDDSRGRPLARASRLVGGLSSPFLDTLDARVTEARRAHGDIIDLSKGNPDLATPPEFVDALVRSVSDPANQGYPPFLVRRGVREAVALRYREDHGVELDPDTQVTGFHGAHEALMAVPRALADPGDTMVVPDPGYPPYLDAARLAGVGVRRLPLREEDGWLPRFGGRADGDDGDGGSDDGSLLTGARLLLLNYPNNPTGAVADAAFWESAVGICREAGVLLVNDLAYGSLDLDHARAASALTATTPGGGSAHPAASPSSMGVVEIGTVSKTYSMAGWRFGWAVGDADAIGALQRYQTVAYSVIFGAVQDAAEAALRGDQASARAITAEYRARRDLMARALSEAGWHVSRPAGTFFLWLRASRGLDGEQVAERLVDQARVVVSPGAGFGEQGRDWVRFSLVQDRRTMKEAAGRLARWLDDVRERTA